MKIKFDSYFSSGKMASRTTIQLTPKEEKRFREITTFTDKRGYPFIHGEVLRLCGVKDDRLNMVDFVAAPKRTIR